MPTPAEEIATLRKELDEIKSKAAPQPRIPDAHAKRLALKAATKKTADGHMYRIPPGGRYYRKGEIHDAGEIITLPEGELPSHTWLAVQDEKPAPKLVDVPVMDDKKKPEKRAADKDI